MQARRGILERLKEDVVLGDGGYVLELERRGYIQAGPYTPEVAVEFPEALEQLHFEFKRAGAEVLQALTFYGSEDKLHAVGRAHQVEEINHAAVRIAREVAGNDAMVAGVVTLTTTFAPGDDKARKRTRAVLEKQVAVQNEGGVDFFIGETFKYLEEALLAFEVIRNSGLPTMITMNIGPLGSKDGVSPEECARRLAGEGAHIVGVNCSFDPEVSLQTAAKMREATDAYIACQPIGYRTPDPSGPFTEHRSFPLALEPSQLTRFCLADYARRAKGIGINYIGGCCGVVAHHVRSMAEALGRQPPASMKSPDLTRHVLTDVRKKADPVYWRTSTGTEAKP